MRTLLIFALQDGLEPTTPWLTVMCSNQLSYWSSDFVLIISEMRCKSNAKFWIVQHLEQKKWKKSIDFLLSTALDVILTPSKSILRQELQQHFHLKNCCHTKKGVGSNLYTHIDNYNAELPTWSMCFTTPRPSPCFNHFFTAHSQCVDHARSILWLRTDKLLTVRGQTFGQTSEANGQLHFFSIHMYVNDFRWLHCALFIAVVDWIKLYF